MLVSFVLTQPANAEQETLHVITAEKSVIMTATPDTKGMKVATLKPGTRVKLMREDGKWSKIEYNGRLGWVQSERIQPFTKDLLLIYSNYYKLLEETEHLVYALVTDFTSDGVEELYTITDADPTKGQYIETIYSGESIIYQRTVNHGLSVLKDSTDYYLFHHSQKNSDKNYKLSQLNEQAAIDYAQVSEGKASYEITANHYFMSYYVMQAGNGEPARKTFTHELVASKEFNGGSETNEYDENIYLEKYVGTSEGQTKTLLEKDYQALFAVYENAKGAKIIYSDDGDSASLSSKFSFTIQQAKNELFQLAENVIVAPEYEGLQEDMKVLKEMLAQSVYLEMPYENDVARNSLTMLKNIEKAIEQGIPGYGDNYFTKATIDFELVNLNYVERMPIDTVIYDFYGTRVNVEEFNTLGAEENRYLTDDYYQYPVDEVEQGASIYRLLQSVQQLDSNYDVLQFTDYEVPNTMTISEANENYLIASTRLQSGYVVLKRLSTNTGTKWVYVDTVSTLDAMNVKQYQIYENTLQIIQQYIAQQQLSEDEVQQKTEDKLTLASANTGQQSESVEAQQISFSWGFLAFLILLIGLAFSGAYYWYRRKIYS